VIAVQHLTAMCDDEILEISDLLLRYENLIKVTANFLTLLLSLAKNCDIARVLM